MKERWERVRLLIPILALAVMMTAFSIPQGPRFQNTTLIVLSTPSKGWPGLTVKVEKLGLELKTDEQGIASFQGVHGYNYTVQIPFNIGSYFTWIIGGQARPIELYQVFR